MKALSLSQPMAWAIFNGKDVENRTWQTKFRGRIYIHASRGFDLSHYDWIALNENRLCCRLPQPEDLTHGAIIGEVDIIDCTRASTSRWAMVGHWNFILANPVMYAEPIPCPGMPGLFEPKLPEVSRW